MSNNTFDFARKEIEKLHSEGLYRYMMHGDVVGAHVVVNGRKLVNMCSNDYLGLPPSMIPNIQMQSSSRLLAGGSTPHIQLEQALAKHKQMSGCLTYPSGYMANLGVVCILAKPGDTIFSDELNHASIVDACRLAGAGVRIYRHNDTRDLESAILDTPGKKIVITEGVFSMDGDIAPLAEISRIVKEAGGILMVDDAHGDFVLGVDGQGTASHLNSRVDVYVSSLSKGLGSFGGYVASNKDVIDLCINKSRPFIYTSALPAGVCGHAIKRLHMKKQRQKQVDKLQKNTDLIARGLKQLGYVEGITTNTKSQTHIIPVIVGDEKMAVAVSGFLFKQGVFAQAVRYPTVKRGQARLRLSITAWLDTQDIDVVLHAFDTARKKFW